MADIPHFSFPFRRTANGKTVEVVEQDMDDEILDCIEVLLTTERGERIELPDYGLPDPLFIQGGTSLEMVRQIIATWEPRANATVTRTELVDMLDRIRIEVLSQDG
jgi:phage baseplate assembly protein W